MIYFLEKKETKIHACPPWWCCEIMPIIILPVVSRHRAAKNLPCRLKKTNSPQTLKIILKVVGLKQCFFLMPIIAINSPKLFSIGIIPSNISP